MARGASEEAEAGPYRLAASPSHLLHRTEQIAADCFTSLAGDNVTLRQFLVLAAIAESPGVSQIDLVRATGIDRSTLAEMLARMQKRDWITRATSAKDARAHTVHIAGAGSTILAAHTPHARAADAAVIEGLARAKRASFLKVLQRIAAADEERAAAAERDARRKARRDAKARAKAKAKPRTRGGSRASAARKK